MLARWYLNPTYLFFGLRYLPFFAKECMKVLPYVLVAIGLFFVLFAVWVRSIPPKGITMPIMGNLTENYTNAPVKAPKEELSEAPAEEPGMTITEDL